MASFGQRPFPESDRQLQKKSLNLQPLCSFEGILPPTVAEEIFKDVYV